MISRTVVGVAPRGRRRKTRPTVRPLRPTPTAGRRAGAAGTTGMTTMTGPLTMIGAPLFFAAQNNVLIQRTPSAERGRRRTRGTIARGGQQVAAVARRPRAGVHAATKIRQPVSHCVPVSKSRVLKNEPFAPRPDQECHPRIVFLLDSTSRPSRSALISSHSSSPDSRSSTGPMAPPKGSTPPLSSAETDDGHE